MNAEQTVHATADELRKLLNEAEDVLAEAGARNDDRVRELRGRIHAALGHARRRGHRVSRAANEQLEHYNEYIHVHPYRALAATLAVGVALALLTGRHH